MFGFQKLRSRHMLRSTDTVDYKAAVTRRLRSCDTFIYVVQLVPLTQTRMHIYDRSSDVEDAA